jgi:peptidoglycan/LPS O-acetylase OafA/YrhL
MLLIAAAALAVVQLGLPVPNPDRHGPWILLAGISLCALCVGIRVEVPWLARIGASSYAIYLFHVFFTAASRIALAKAGLTPLPLQILAGVVLGVAAPMLVEHWAARYGAARLLLLGQSFRAARPRSRASFAPPAGSALG